MHPALLVPRQDHPDVLLFIQDVEDLEHDPAGVTEERIDFLLFQAFEEDFSTGYFFG
jgi:hypothetical protein